jgi:hypothetical protein
VRAGPLSNHSILDLLAPFVITTWHGKEEA